MTTTSAQRDEYRLTARDEDCVRAALRRTCTGGHRPHVDVLARVAAHAVACTLDDLRASELAWIAAEIDEVTA